MFLKVNSVALQINKYCEQNQPIIAVLPDISLLIIIIAGQPEAMVPSQHIFLGKGLDYGHGLRPCAVLETSGAVFPYTDRPRPVNNIHLPVFKTHS